MASNYAGFPVRYRTTLGVLASVGPGVEISVRVEGDVSDVAESPLVTDSNGEIAPGTLAAVSVGSVVRFRGENFEGLSGTSIVQITT